MTQFQLTIPARFNILGNPGDANEGAFATISAAVDLHAFADIPPLWITFLNKQIWSSTVLLACIYVCQMGEGYKTDSAHAH
jgi:hypothetical protein